MECVRRLGVTSLTAIGYPAAGEIVRRKLDVDVVARRDADAEPPQTSCEAREDRVAVLELDLERRAGERLDDAADEAQRVFFDDGGQGLAALFAAAALASARRGNGSSFGRSGMGVRRERSPSGAESPATALPETPSAGATLPRKGTSPSPAVS